MKINCAVFDFDGTLFDSMFVWDTAGEDYLRSIGRIPSPTLREDLRTMSLLQAAEHFKTAYGVELTADEIIEGINKTVGDHYLYDILPKPGAERFLEQMKERGIPMCIATATDRCLIEAALKRCKLDGYFDAVFTCGEVGHSKNEPVIFRKAMEHFGADRESTLVFEDALHAARTAKADGFRVIAVYDPSETQQTELRSICGFCLEDYENTDDFWKYASAL